MRMASSTAWRLSTGSEPGQAEAHRADVGVGLVAEGVAAAAEQLGGGGQLAVDLEPDDRLPAGGGRGGHRRRSAPGRPRPGTGRGSPRAGASSWTPTGRPSSPVPKGTEMAGWPARLDGMVHTSDRYMVSGSSVLAPSAKAVVGDVGDSSRSNVGVGGLEVADDQRADPLGLAVVGVVVAGRQGVGAEHDAALDLGAEAGGPGGAVHGGRRRRRRPAGRSARRRSGPGCSTPRPGRSGSRPTGRRSTAGTDTSSTLAPAASRAAAASDRRAATSGSMPSVSSRTTPTRRPSTPSSRTPRHPGRGRRRSTWSRAGRGRR